MAGEKVITCKGKFFNGFLYVHPGTKPQGHITANWSTVQAKLLPELDIPQTVHDLKELGYDELYLASVRTYKRLS